ncbi:beta-1,4-galactosyltransferase 7 [Brevipalpus obovatus]|uniref:beta-1,4-galactosyltransferase 7 n=1 Tax=Brevipalpus obovatus TaxID=246614 RepID=UPI003D9F49A2
MFRRRCSFRIFLLFLIIFGVLFWLQQMFRSSTRGDSSKMESHVLAVLIPFRDRFSELMILVPHLHRFLTNQKLTFTLNIINQNDSLRFNRASLINAGYLLTKDRADYIAMHDVDLLPLNPNLDYGYPEGDVYHISSPQLHPKYKYKKYIGGILLVTRIIFEKVNGMSNKYWGWGLEDDEFYQRLKEVGVEVNRPGSEIKTDRNDTFLHIHSSFRKRDYNKYFNQKEVSRKRDRDTGLSNIRFELTSTSQLVIDGFPCQVFNVKLFCDYNLTPWCDTAFATKNRTRKTL